MKPAKSKKQCPHCKKEVVWENNPHRPFCSERCKMADLGHWAMENYRIPGEKTEETPLEKKKGENDVD